jgi:hypothetical protein
MQNVTQKLEGVETSMRRWHTRLTRASNMLHKLERQRRRLQQQGQTTGTAKPKVSTIDVDEVKRQLDAAIDTTIPPLLKRDVDVDRLKAERVAKVDKSKMPLTGRAALDAIRPKKKA